MLRKRIERTKEAGSVPMSFSMSRGADFIQHTMPRMITKHISVLLTKATTIRPSFFMRGMTKKGLARCAAGMVLALFLLCVFSVSAVYAGDSKLGTAASDQHNIF